jgi:hypothetical protein
MKLSAKLRLFGFIMCCAGIVFPVASMYQLKLVVVDHVQMSPSWIWAEAFIVILVVFSGGGLMCRAARLSKEGK